MIDYRAVACPLARACYAVRYARYRLIISATMADRRILAGAFLANRLRKEGMPGRQTAHPCATRLLFFFFGFEFFEDFLILFAAEVEASEEVGATGAGAADSFFATPAGDVGVVAGEQDIGH